MDIFICHDDGVESGPYSWVDIFVMLNSGELDDRSLVRIGSEIQSITDWNHWDEGTDVGPLTWDEISVMLQAGVLDLEVQAKLEGASELTRLQDVISQSQEAHLLSDPARAKTPPNLIGQMSQAFQNARTIPHARMVTVVAFLLVLVGIIYFGVYAGNRELPAENNLEIDETVELNAPPLEVPDSQHYPAPTLVVNSTPAPTRTETADKTVAEAEPAIPALSPISSPTVEEIAPEPDSKGHIPENIAKNEVQPSPTSNTREPAPELPDPSQAKVPDPPLIEQKPKITQTVPSSTPLPKSRSTPQTTVATSLRDFFEILSIKFLKKEPKDGIGVWLFTESEAPPKTLLPDVFQPCLQVEVLAKGNTYSKNLTAKAYFFNQNNKLIASALKPSKVGTKSQRTHFDMPVLFHKEQPTNIFFEIPETIRSQKWTAVIVFGDKDEAQSVCYPHTARDFLLNYPEKELVYDRTTVRPARKSVMDPLIEYVVKTKNPKHPHITLFLRPPKGINDWSEVQGVYALVVLANSVDDIRRRMQAIELEGDEAGSFAFANKHKLAILMWGSRSIWNARRNFDDYDRREARELDRNFDMVANAWEEAIQHFHEEYGTPTNNFILQGSCGAAQWAKRLCLRKPDYFLAAHIHLAGSYDQPTPEAAKVLWCVTTTEQDGGYERSLKFLTACREMGYPIMYKAATPQSAIGSLGYQFFEYAMTLKEKREEYELEMTSPFRKPENKNDKTPRPWVEAFAEPPFYGDVVNQEEFSAKDVEQIPNAFRSAIPTKQLADIWKQK